MLPEAVGQGQHFQARGHSFSLYGPTRKPANNLFVFFPAVTSLTRGFVYARLSLNWLTTRRLQIIAKNLTSERASNSDTRQKKMY